MKTITLPPSKCFFPPKRETGFTEMWVCTSEIQWEKGKEKMQKERNGQMRVTVRQWWFHQASEWDETYGVESKLMLLACVDDADLWLEEKTGRLGEACITWSTRWPTDDGRSRVPSCTNSEFLINTDKGLSIRPENLLGTEGNAFISTKCRVEIVVVIVLAQLSMKSSENCSRTLQTLFTSFENGLLQAAGRSGFSEQVHDSASGFLFFF